MSPILLQRRDKEEADSKTFQALIKASVDMEIIATISDVAV
jgi:hypothetical protein